MVSLRFITFVLGIVCISLNAADAIREGTQRQRFTGEHAAVGRRLRSASSTNSTQCVWTYLGCDLNPDYVTTLSGAPVTESQKLVARTSALSKVCGNYTTSAACLANPNNYCTWSGGKCFLGNGYINLDWLSGRVDCPGSLADTATTCLRLASEGACATNSKCTWDPTGLSSFASGFATTVSDWINSGATAQCVPKWITDANTINNLVNKIVQALNASLSGDASAALRAVFPDMFGSCRGATAYLNLLTTCTSLASDAANSSVSSTANRTTIRAACLGNPGCSWGSGDCDIADDFPLALLLNQTDTWVSTLQTAKKQCLPLNETACTALATFPVNASRYVDFANAQQPVFTSGDTSGGAGAPASPAAATILLGLLVAFLLALLTRAS